MTKQKRVFELLQEIEIYLERNGCEPTVGEWLVLHHLAVSRSELFMQYRDNVRDAVVDSVWADVHQHVDQHVPVQHIIGEAAFYGRSFQVTPDTLIPRPETEEVVEAAIKQAKDYLVDHESITIVDIGTGSGVIAITLKLELGDRAHVYAVDISQEALQVAQDNSEHLDARVIFLEGNLLEPIKEQSIQPTMIVSNPPYISYQEKEALSPVVVNHDPHLALFADDDGLYFYKEIIQSIKRNDLQRLHCLVFEIGHTQGEALQTYIETELKSCHVIIEKDIEQNDRILTILFPDS